jgi:hypothetical protein
MSFTLEPQTGGGFVLNQVGGAQGPPGGTIPVKRLVVIIHGESNAGGYGLNSAAQSWEVGTRAELQLLNPVTLLLENLRIGGATANNLLAHQDMGSLSQTQHGWELSLANMVKLGDFPADTVVVKTGQGSSDLLEWNVGNASTYWTQFLSRIAAVESAVGLSSDKIDYVVWYTLGINDEIDGTTPTNYKNWTIAHLAKMRARLGANTPILMTRLPAAYSDYETVIGEIDSEDPFTYAIPVSGLALQDSYHWGYAEMKKIASRMGIQTLTHLGRTRKGITWKGFVNTEQDGFELKSTGSASGGANSKYWIDATKSFSVVVDYEGSSTEGVVIGIHNDPKPVTTAWVTNDSVLHTFFSGGSFYWGDSSGFTAVPGVTFPCKVKMEKSGNNVTVSTSTDGGTTWTLRHTKANALLNIPVVWVKAHFVGTTTNYSVRVSQIGTTNN